MQFLLSKKFQRLTRLYHTIIARDLPELPFDNLIEILLVIHQRLTNNTHTQFAEILNLDKSRVSIHVEYLNTHGFTKTEINPEDQRQHLTFLTPKGEAAVAKIEEVIARVNKVINQDLSLVQLNIFYTVIRQMEHNLLTNLD
ncbi:MarR family winged helix-turn-helix transcriptional regulator [Mucilaginibacter aquariorum]|uniref:MarR family winged helix-turn-helix transcriptional regulator n=1 Tax=Mucilaginibacter aquariorum TaxID=2967225 RepID=A0ABT1T3T1_9SPHI|nr:MarR family winged helix-turn-helix transcriptional regulator [Mucilaginibacter aquariorum]MCQ6959128.1 MarR family winged helix-turn-helix transcriptional regulator [Mucilaginibacter aquariorum]